MFHSSAYAMQAPAIVLFTGVIFAVDVLTSLDIAVAVLYVVVVLMAANVCSRRGVLVATAICLALTVSAFAITHDDALSGALGRCLVSLAAIGITAVLALAGQAATAALRQREEALRLSEAFLSSTQGISRTSSFSFKAPEAAMYWSDEAARTYGVGPEVIPTVALLLARTHPDDVALVQVAVDCALRGEPTIDLRHRLLMPDGSVTHVHVLARLSGSDGGRHEYLGALMNVSAAHEAAEALHRVQVQLEHVTRVTTLGELAASIAHEVNQPLAAVAANGEACLRWLNRREPDLVEAREAVIRILGDTERAGEVIKRVRDLSRKSDPQFRPIALNQVVGETAVLIERELSRHRVKLSMELAPDLPEVQGDPVQLQQVIINLLMNGIQAMSADRQLERHLHLCSQHAENGCVMLSVSDSGQGIAAPILARLFEPFFTTKRDGMGMGLPICRSIIEAHGGRIWARADDGAGATMQFSLPVMRATP
jgi:two-component system sensor kinase FixL